MLDLTHSQPARAAHQALRPLRFARLTSILGKALALSYRLSGKDRYDDYRLERVHGVPLLVIPSVFNPKIPRTGAYLAAQLDVARVPPGAEVLDLGTGSGVCAIFAARHARRVVAVDINPAAVRCAGINARLNHLEHRIEVRAGDLFDPVAGERFDLVIFNPPFLCGAPRSDRDRAWRSMDVAERFAAQLSDHLKPNGRALVVLSTFGNARLFLEQVRRVGVAISVLAERRFVNERLAVFGLEPPHRGTSA
ncbi:MAG TPA: HemK2/MTQ2 family protein methyltransferase [Steroidobacteraceae bacterium]|nr:HemK2/MTQ2 family protein methyltransferase [Steroidobacteraceae bacterium]